MIQKFSYLFYCNLHKTVVGIPGGATYVFNPYKFILLSSGSRDLH